MRLDSTAAKSRLGRRARASALTLLGLLGGFVALFGSAAPAVAAKCPNLHIVLDRSGSMSTTVSGSKTRWDVAKEAITAVLDRYDGKFPIGFSIFPRSGCDSDLITEPAYKTKMKIVSAMAASGPSGSTPSGTAMNEVRNMVKALRDAERKQYILLITDGGPGCGTLDTCNGTVNEIDAALKATPSITTFVVGFGGGLSSSESQCLSQMAAAGGHPDMTALKYYKADNAADLSKALEGIIEVVMGGGDVGMGGLCDDTCYSNGCKIAGDICVGGECNPNPCAGVMCPKDSYCYTDGKSTGVCVRACTKPCPKGTRCNMGACAADPCPYACPAGTVCNANAKRCEVDPLCGMMAPDEKCRGTSACRAGVCVDDPCRYLTCPKGTRCVPWEGTCDFVPLPIEEMPPDPMDNTDDEKAVRAAGCSTIPGGAESASVGGGALFLLGLLRARRRRS